MLAVKAWISLQNTQTYYFDIGISLDHNTSEDIECMDIPVKSNF